MKGMSQRIEQIAGARLLELGSPVSTRMYHHNKADKNKYKLNPGEHDCLTCRKTTTHIIPNNKRCIAICGNKKRQTRSNNN